MKSATGAPALTVEARSSQVAASWDGSQQSHVRRTDKKRGVVFSFTGVMLGMLVTLTFHFAGFWHVSLEAWSWLTLATVIYHSALWLIPHLGWDERLRWDTNYLYLPWACVTVFFSVTVYFLPDARMLIPFGFLVTLLRMVGLASFRQVLCFSLAMSGGYLVAVSLLASQGGPVVLPYEASLAGLILALGIMAGTVIDRVLRHRWELAGLRRRLTLAIQGSGAGWWDVVLDPTRPAVIRDEVHLSADLKALIGFEDHEFPNSLRAWHDRIDGADRDEIIQSARRQLAGLSQARETRYRIRHKNGELRQIYSHSRIQRNSEGVPVRWSGLEWDVTDRERALEDVRKLSLVVEQSPSLVIITDTRVRSST